MAVQFFFFMEPKFFHLALATVAALAPPRELFGVWGRSPWWGSTWLGDRRAKPLVGALYFRQNIVH